MVFVFNIDDAPLVGAGADHFAVDIECPLGTNDGEWNFILQLVQCTRMSVYLDLSVECTFFFVEFVIVVRIHFEIMEGEFSFDLDVSENNMSNYPLFEGLTFGEGEGI